MQAGRTLHERDPAVAERQQVLRREPRGAAVVYQHARAVEVARGERHDGRAGRLQRVDRLAQRRGVARILVTAAGEHHARGVVVAQHFEVRELGAQQPVGVADHRQMPLARRDVLDPARDLGEVRIDDVADDHADDPARALDQRACQLARPVAELICRRQHPRPRRLRHRVEQPLSTRDAVAMETPARRLMSAPGMPSIAGGD